MGILLEKALFIGLFGGFILSHAGRIQIGEGVVIAITDLFVGALGVLFLLRTKGKSIVSHPFAMPFMLFIGALIVSLAVNAQFYKPYEVGVAFLYTIRWSLYAFLVFVVWNASDYMKTFIRNGMIVSGIFLLFIGFVQRVWFSDLRMLFFLGWDDHMHRLVSTFLDPNFAGAFFVLYTLFLGGLFFHAQHQRRKTSILVFGVLTAASLGAVFLTHSRSALLMLLVSIFFLLLLFGKLRWMIGIVGVVLVVQIAFAPLFYIENINLFRVVSSEARLETARNAVMIFQKHPLFGVGFNAYRYAQLRYKLRNPIGARVSHADAGADNSFLFLAATAGIGGLITFLYLMFSIGRFALFSYKKNRAVLGAVVFASIIGLFFNSLFINSWFFMPLVLWFWLLVGIMESMRQ